MRADWNLVWTLVVAYLCISLLQLLGKLGYLLFLWWELSR